MVWRKPKNEINRKKSEENCNCVEQIVKFIKCGLSVQGVSERTVQLVVLEPFRNLMVYRVE